MAQQHRSAEQRPEHNQLLATSAGYQLNFGQYAPGVNQASHPLDHLSGIASSVNPINPVEGLLLGGTDQAAFFDSNAFPAARGKAGPIVSDAMAMRQNLSNMPVQAPPKVGVPADAQLTNISGDAQLLLSPNDRTQQDMNAAAAVAAAAVSGAAQNDVDTIAAFTAKNIKRQVGQSSTALQNNGGNTQNADSAEAAGNATDIDGSLIARLRGFSNVKQGRLQPLPGMPMSAAAANAVPSVGYPVTQQQMNLGQQQAQQAQQAQQQQQPQTLQPGLQHGLPHSMQQGLQHTGQASGGMQSMAMGAPAIEPYSLLNSHAKQQPTFAEVPGQYKPGGVGGVGPVSGVPSVPGVQGHVQAQLQQGQPQSRGVTGMSNVSMMPGATGIPGATGMPGMSPAGQANAVAGASTGREVSTERPFKCKYCPASFGRRDNMRKHMRSIHMGERPFVCEKCNFAFQKKDHKDKHVRTVHLKERPYHCEQCDSRFGQKSDLTKHVRTVHDRIKPFHCEHCGLSFGHRGNKLRHVFVVHEKRKPHICRICNVGFGERSNLAKHSLAVHKQPPE